MADIVFKPKYKAAFWCIFALLLVLAASVLGAGIMILLVALQRQIHVADTIMMAGFFAMFVLIMLCSLNFVTRKITLGNNGISVATLLGTIRKRPFAPKAYYEQGCFIINGFVYSGGFLKNAGELDSELKKHSAKGELKYVREKGVLASQPAGYTTVMLISACILGILFSYSIGMLMPWVYIIVVDAMFLVWLIFSFNKLPRARKSIIKQLSVYFE